MQAEDAFEFIVSYLSGSSVGQYMNGSRMGSGRGSDIYMPDLAWKYWRPLLDMEKYRDSSRLTDIHMVPFYDAAWELCRIGVLRPGTFAPKGMVVTGAFGDLYSVTEFGIEWLKMARPCPVVDPSRMSQVLLPFGRIFGKGFEQRASEAVRSYRTTNYLAACVMAGAAGESILLSVAIAKVKDESKVLSVYNGASGRRKVTQSITGGLTSSVGAQFNGALSVLHFWRDDASHGTITTISEIEAHASLTQLIRLAQFTSDHWAILTA